MAAMQSRATLHRAGARHHQEDEANETGSTDSTAVQIRGRTSRRAQPVEQESWVLFAPKRALSPAQPATVDDRTGRSPGSSSITVSQATLQRLSYQDAQDPYSAEPLSDATVSASWHVLDTPNRLSPPVSPPAPGLQRDVSLSRPALQGSEAHSPASESFGLWSTVPKHESSQFFDDTELETSTPEEPLHGSIYPSLEVDGSRNNLAEHKDRILSSIPSELTDALSLPSSLSVSERSTSVDASLQSSPQLGLRSRNNKRSEHSEHLTAAALSRIASIATDDISLGGDDEAGLTSGSEDERELDADEMLLSKTPDAMSAGIRPIRQRPLQTLSAAAVPQRSGNAIDKSAVSGQDKVSSASSNRLSSVSKRRHRRAGLSDKGSKRSNIGDSADIGLSAKGQRGKQTSGQASEVRHRAPRSKTYSFGQAARRIFEIDQDLLAMVARSGSVLDQPVPDRLADIEARLGGEHGYSALSAHMASELGESENIRTLFSAYDHDRELDSGDETETEQHASRYAKRFPLQQHMPGDLYIEHDPHTASLGLHRAFSLTGLQHFLVDSVYNSLSSLTAAASPSLSTMDHTARKRTRSAPGIERSHSSSELPDLDRIVASDQAQQGYNEAVSYWRRVLRSLVA